MEKLILASLFVSFVTSSDVLKFKPSKQQPVIARDLWVDAVKPAFCNGLDCPEYKVISKTDDYEVRKYKKSNWVSTNLNGIEYSMASYTMFKKLFNYIKGANVAKKEIAMTAPVTNRIIPGQGPACETNFTMSFFVSPSAGAAPPPTDKTVFLSAAKSFTVYVRSFGGFAETFEDWRKEAQLLGKALDKAELSYETEYYFTAGYDAPFKIFNRHNEVWFFKK